MKRDSGTERVGQIKWDKDSGTDTVRDIRGETVRCKGSGTETVRQKDAVKQTGGRGPRTPPVPRAPRPRVKLFIVESV